MEVSWNWFGFWPRTIWFDHTQKPICTRTPFNKNYFAHKIDSNVSFLLITENFNCLYCNLWLIDAHLSIFTWLKTFDGRPTRTTCDVNWIGGDRQRLKWFRKRYSHICTYMLAATESYSRLKWVYCITLMAEPLKIWRCLQMKLNKYIPFH